MPIASWGPETFKVSWNQIYTFKGFSVSESLDIENQEVEGRKPNTYIKGYKLSEIPITIQLDSRFVNVRSKWGQWHTLLERKVPYNFILGSKPILNAKFLLTDVNLNNTVINHKGELIKATLELKFQEYSGRGYKKEETTKTKNKQSEKIKKEYIVNGKSIYV